MKLRTINPKIKYPCIIGIVVLLIVSVIIIRKTSLPETIEFSWPGVSQIGQYYYNVQKLAESAHNVFRAEIVGVRNGEVEIGDTEIVRWNYRMYELEVVEVYRGSLLSKDVIELMQMTRSRNRFILETSGVRYRTVPLIIGNEYVLFTRTISALNRLHPHPDEPQILLNSWQAAYRCFSEINALSEAIKLERVDPRNSLILTVYDLRSLSE